MTFFIKINTDLEKNHSTQTSLISFTDKLTEALDKNNYVIGLFLDLSKAFDTIDHSILVNKLQKYGIRGIPLDFIKNYLSGRSQLVSFNGCHSELRDVKCGVPQGSILGPFLFSLYINDIYKCAPLLKFFLFADDTSLLYHSKSLPFLIKIINQELKKLKLWLEINKSTLKLIHN